MITYNLAPVPLWNLRDNLGEPLANGYMKAYRNTVRSQFKAVYQNPAGTIAYVQPITFNAAGFQGPFYWASDENYYLEIYDSNNILIRTIPDYNAPQDGGIVPITSNINFINYITDPQFYYAIKSSFSPLSTLQQISTSNWFFAKNNTSATDEILIVPFIPGTTVPPNNPTQFFRYECSVAGSGEVEKDLAFVFNNVNSWQNRQFTFALWGESSTTANVIEIIVLQHFGTGGSPSPDVFTPITSFALPALWAQFTDTFVAPSITGKVLGTNNDSYFAFIIRMPLDAVTTIDLDNVQFNDGSQLLPFDYVPPTNSATLQIPDFIAATSKNSILGIGGDKYLEWLQGTTDTYLTVNSSDQIGWTPIPVFYSFQANGALLALSTSFQIVPFTPTVNPLGWIAGNRFTPTLACTCFLNPYFFGDSATGGIEIQTTAFFNGSFALSSQSLSLNTAGSSGEFMLPTLINFNGTTDYVEFASKLSGTGTAGVTMAFCFITVLHYP